MKKLIIVATAIGMAVAAQAAKIDWAIMDATAAEGCTIYACSGVAEFKNAGEIASYLYGDNYNSGVIDSGMAMDTAVGIDGSLVGSDKTVYLVCVNQANTGYWVTTAVGDIYDVSTTPEMALGDGSGWTSDNWTPWATSPTPPEPTPEPTSGLLLLLGVAGLALRRKQK